MMLGVVSLIPYTRCAASGVNSHIGEIRPERYRAAHAHAAERRGYEMLRGVGVDA